MVGEIVLIVFSASEHLAGGVAIGTITAFGSLVVAAAAAMFEGILRDAVQRMGIDDA